MDRKDEYKDFEQLLENHGAIEAIGKYYKRNARIIIIGVLSLAIMIGLRATLPVGQRLTVIAGLLIVKHLYGRVRKWQK